MNSRASGRSPAPASASISLAELRATVPRSEAIRLSEMLFFFIRDTSLTFSKCRIIVS